MSRCVCAVRDSDDPSQRRCADNPRRAADVWLHHSQRYDCLAGLEKSTVALGFAFFTGKWSFTGTAACFAVPNTPGELSLHENHAMDTAFDHEASMKAYLYVGAPIIFPRANAFSFV